MANQAGKRRNRISMPGHRSGLSRGELRNLLSGLAPSTSPAPAEYLVNEIKPVQESGHSGSANMNITKPEADESHNLSPVSEYGQKGRDHYRSSGSNPVSDETCPRQISEERQNEFVHMDGPGGTLEKGDDVESNIRQRSIVSLNKDNLQRQQNTSHNESENGRFNSHVTNVLQPGNTYDAKEQDLNTVKDHDEEESYNRTSATSSFCVSSCDISFMDSSKGLLNSSICPKSGRDSIKHSEKLEDLINSLQVKLSISTQEGSELEYINIRNMLLSLIEKVYKHCDHDNIDASSISSLHSFILMRGWSRGKNSFDPVSRQLLPSVPPNNEMNNILRAECREPHCSKLLCQKVQQCLSRLQDIEVPVTDLRIDEQEVLSCMYDHCQSCEYLHCPLYWCQKEALCRITDHNESLAKMKQLVEHGYHPNFLDDMKKGCFVKFFHGLPSTDVPREPEDWGGLYRLTGANNTILVQSADEERREYWIIKKCRMYKSHSQMDLYETLRQISHKGIALHLWTVFCPDIRYMAVCLGYEVFSLYERLQESPLKNLHIVVRIMLQLIHTTGYLHENGILYLNWSSRNIVYSTAEHFKLTNFTCSAMKSRVDEDIADISLSLPRHLIAPEMLESMPKADEKTDIWGLGCLLKEIFSGQPMWYEYLHEPNSVLQKKIMMVTPSRPHDCLDLFSTFRACWERQRADRPSLEELAMLLVHAKEKQMYR